MDDLSNITIAQAKAGFLESAGRPRSTSTILAYSSALDAFSNMLAGQNIDISTFPVSELTENSVVDYVNYTKNLAPATETLYLQVMKNFFEFLDAESLTAIKISRVRMLIRKRTRRPKAQALEYPEQEIKRLIDAMQGIVDKSIADCNQVENNMIRDKRDSALILTLADTGLRVDEVCRLKLNNIDWVNSCAILTGRGNKQSFVRLSTRALHALSDYLDLRDKSNMNSQKHLYTEPVFARHDKGAGKKIMPITTTAIRKIVAERVNQVLGAEAVGRITPHTFLHYFVTTILRTTGNLKIAQELARHVNIQMTQKYAHVSDDELDRAYYGAFEQKEKARMSH